ncbi:MAG: type IV pilus modification PilV family protein, partial [Myxococcales bacterium]
MLAIPIAMQRRRHGRGFSLLETMIALVLVAFAMTALVLAFAGSGKFGVLSRRQANAVALGRSIAGQLNLAAYTDARLLNSNTQNDASFADPNGLFAQQTLPTGNDAPDSSLGTFTVGSEAYQVYVNVAPLM